MARATFLPDPTPFAQTTKRRASRTRVLLAVLALSIALQPAHAQRKSATDDGLANEPIGAKNSAKPNIMMTLDDSGSMNWDFLPDQIVGNISSINNGGNYCRDATGAMAQACGGNASVTYYKMYTQTDLPVAGAATPPRSALWAVPGRLAAFNAMAYNPAIEYRPPLTANPAVSFPEQDATQTVNWTKVQVDPFLSPSTKISMNNLSAPGQLTVGRWCNSDYPIDVNSGDECRLNGVVYSAGANGAPAVFADWNYPVRPKGFSLTSSKPVAANFHYTDYAVWCKTSGVSWSSADADAAGSGTNCRRNNKAYTSSPAVTAKLDNYPSSPYSNRISKGADTIANVINSPWHYWRGSVEWCKTAVPAAATGATTKWEGFGKWAAGECQNFADGTFKYPRFFGHLKASGYDNVSNRALERVTLDFNAPATHDASYVDATGVLVSQTRDFITDTYNAKGEVIKRSEMTNFANWFAYYRARVLAAKTAASRAFGNLDKEFRVGFNVFNDTTTGWLSVNDFDVGAAQRTNWYTKLLDVDPSGGTPTFSAITRVGDYFAGVSSPITHSCQKNWHVLFTDGYANDTSNITGPAKGKNIDGSNVPNPFPTPASPSDAVANHDPSLVAGSPWPWKYREGTTAQTNTLADLATHYWMTDLKTTGALATNNVPASAIDPASWQHVNFAAISFGTRGTLDVSNQVATISSLASGARRWPAWVSNGPEAVDDLWHAAVNGRGRFVNASNPDELVMGLAQIVQDIANQAGSRVGVGFTTVSLSETANYVYKARFEPGWGGSLKKVQIDPATGNETGVIAWSAADRLANLLTPSGPDPTPWLSDRPLSARKIVTMNGSTAVPFRLANLSPAQRLALDGDTTRQQLLVEFLRGSSANEGIEIGKFRQRSLRLGDIANSQPLYVGPKPREPYLDVNDPGYSAFKSATTRAPRVYVGANDGMLHAFDDNDGREVWAYMPRALHRSGGTGLAGLAYQEGGVPLFRHYFYVDATPSVADVPIDGVWKTLLVGGLGKGGNSYYAIDITNPGSPSTETESDVAAKVLWEFTDPDLGYTYGKPIIVKTYAYGWVMIVPSGYNNPSGVGKVFVVDIKTGTKLRTFTTNFGSSASPSGLAHISGYTKDHRNPFVEQVYGGDLQGNLWRFDLSDPDSSNWQLSVSEPFARFVLGGVPQPITTPPQIEVDIANGIDRWVFIGTGRLLDAADLNSNEMQTMYAIRDGTATTPKPISTAVTRSSTGMFAVTSKTPLGSKPQTGWYDDLPTGQRIITPVKAEASIVVYAAARPQTDPCIPGNPATLYARDYSRGGSRLQDASANFIESIDIEEGVAGIELVAVQSVTASATGMPDIRVSITQARDGALKTIKMALPLFVQRHRISWRTVQ